MRIAACAVAVLIVTVLSGCGTTQDPTRHQIAAYLTAVDKLERQLATPLTTIDTVDKQLTAGGRGSRAGASKGPTAAAQERRLGAAAVQIRAVEAKLRALAAPAAAAHLRALVLQLAAQQAHLTDETRRLITFIPGFSRALRPLGPAVVRLERILSVNQAAGASAVQAVYARKAAALRTFAGALAHMNATLGRLTPPQSSRPTYASERRSLRQMQAAATSLASDLQSGHTSSVQAVLHRFDVAAAIPGSRKAQVAERDAVRAYDREVTRLDALVGAADQERLRLAKAYP